MEMATRSSQVSAAFVKVAGTLVGDYDVLDLLQVVVEQSVELLDGGAAGVMVADSGGTLQVLASTSEESQLVETLQQESGAGPCVECYIKGAPVTIRDIASTHARWPQFSQVAGSLGYRSVHAFPMRLQGRTIGAINLFRADVGELTDNDVAIGQALADVSTISILQKRTLQESIAVQDQLQRALDSRILIEQAKGMIAQMQDTDTGEAFRRLRNHARTSHQKLHETAAAVVNRSLTV
ncbi:GAF and ANTAR domain-containing protein [Arthrobacter sp. AET 35A]|uniref:GAF and ANTAR domain-containing protein n=1 Tax=Arthrobacter sp. AET 35A TaxID=2292643 RepID=UPI001782A367|nr:GAF and ANTAR domain-containing protein [Arthrobacter sp. AET 35A]MBE0011108.1 ANTAR domain-containing protein [Arthrobacter sp. AET 35A]